MTKTPWPHQARAVNEILDTIQQGRRRICLQAPTGTGKTLIMHLLAEHYLQQSKPVALFTHRILLLEQSFKVFGSLNPGIVAAHYEPEPQKDFQICSLQTVHSRMKRQGKHYRLPRAALVLIDEAHVQTGHSMRTILESYLEQGAVIVGVTATPLDLGDMYDALVIGCTLKEGRSVGAIVPSMVYAPDEPDVRRLKMIPGVDPSERDVAKVMMNKTIIARVREHYLRLNPAQRPAILFAPGVKESLWFAKHLTNSGIPAAHIDGHCVWYNGQEYGSHDIVLGDTTARQHVLNLSRSGDIKIICNRFVLREGIDAPWLEHCILATIYGSLQSYLQSVGRILRASPATNKASAIIQDHGGNWWRHGSPNQDRVWRLGDSSRIVASQRIRSLMADKEPEPRLCPECLMVLSGTYCPQCEIDLKPNARCRMVVQLDGTLKQVNGKIFRPRAIDRAFDAVAKWRSVYYRAKNSRRPMSFNQAIALYAYENHWLYPDPSWPLMPVEPVDFYRKVRDVPYERLIPCPFIEQKKIRNGSATSPSHLFQGAK